MPLMKKYYYEYPDSLLFLAGIDLNRATVIHYAEQRAGKNLFRRWAKIEESVDPYIEVNVGSCSEGFKKLDNYVQEIERTIYIGESKCKVYPFKQFVDLVTDVIHFNPELTHCGNKECTRCNDMANGGSF